MVFSAQSWLSLKVTPGRAPGKQGMLGPQPDKPCEANTLSALLSLWSNYAFLTTNKNLSENGLMEPAINTFQSDSLAEEMQKLIILINI